MKILTTEELSDRLDVAFAWRLKELHTLRTSATQKRAEADRSSRDTALRVAVVMLYAHWEGFVKEIATCYLQFLNSRRLRCAELQPNLVAVTMRGRLDEAIGSRKATVQTDMVRFIMDATLERFNADPEKLIRTANLNSEVFRDIAVMLGIDYSPFETKARLIDEALLRRRNRIAHGEHLDIDAKSYDELHKEILAMLRLFSDGVVGLARSGAYRRSSE